MGKRIEVVVRVSIEEQDLVNLVGNENPTAEDLVVVLHNGVAPVGIVVEVLE